MLSLVKSYISACDLRSRWQVPRHAKDIESSPLSFPYGPWISTATTNKTTGQTFFFSLNSLTTTHTSQPSIILHFMRITATTSSLLLTSEILFPHPQPKHLPTGYILCTNV